MILISPSPKSMIMHILGSRWLDFYATNTVEWFKKINSEKPEIYGNVKFFLKETIFPELEVIEFKDKTSANTMNFSFRKDNNETKIKFDYLSDGQKCFVLGAIVYAVAKSTVSSFCFWDEPENYVSSNEIQKLVSLLKAGYGEGQFFTASHSMETLKVFSENDVIVLKRKSQTEPAMPPIFLVMR